MGTSYSSIEIARLANLKGVDLIACGNRAEDPAVRLARSRCHVDYSDRHALMDAVRRLGPDYAIPSCNDASYISAAWVADELRLPGFDDFRTTLMLHTKARFRALLADLSLPSPEFAVIDRGSADDPRAAGAIDYPVLVKPVDRHSGLGIS
ncbi:MAG: ATP-grasp domain-containing protein, partial [Candidatus Nanopelagicales bacterium]